MRSSGVVSTRGFTPLRTFRIRKVKGRPVQPDREFMAELDRALPVGNWWRDEVLAGRAEYPPHPTATPPQVCQRRGDRGRLYPAPYVDGDRCYDCHLQDTHRSRIQFAREHDRVFDGRAASDEEVLAETTPPPEPYVSPTAVACEELARRGIILVESKLETEDPAALQRLIDRHTSAAGTRAGRVIV